MAIVIVLSMLSRGSGLPGSKGTLMASLGFVALAAGAIELLRWVRYIFNTLGMGSTLLLIVALAGTLVMAHAGWGALQAEGGRWRFGRRASADTDAAERPADRDGPPGS